SIYRLSEFIAAFAVSMFLLRVALSSSSWAFWSFSVSLSLYTKKSAPHAPRNRTRATANDTRYTLPSLWAIGSSVDPRAARALRSGQLSTAPAKDGRKEQDRETQWLACLRLVPLRDSRNVRFYGGPRGCQAKR